MLEVWNTYLRDLDTGDFDVDRCDEIYDKLDVIADIKYLGGLVSKGEKLEDIQKEILTSYIDVTVSEEEIKYRRAYIDYLHKQSEMRIGKNICAHDVIMRAWRVWKVISFGAPEIIIFNEARQFAAAFVLHECGISKELVDNNIRLRIEQMEQMSEEELDELCRPQKTNTRKSLAPLFIYEILLKNSDSKNHMRQEDIRKKLFEYPYEISLERKAVGRIIHNLVDSMQYSIYQDKTGVWIEQGIKA